MGCAVALIGVLVYGWFQSSLSQAADAVISSRELVKRPSFLVVILPIVAVTTNLIHFLLVLPTLGLAYLITAATERKWDHF